MKDIALRLTTAARFIETLRDHSSPVRIERDIYETISHLIDYRAVQLDGERKRLLEAEQEREERKHRG
ncbi:hypothetical protein LCGC14_2434470 [marine sediment metagenome]|uniref:Uncharacterized protein n=1 Tax=marine sediment metagenome TaxID=412755 RepID=A0A0F9BKW4_9ZZZZ